MPLPFRKPTPPPPKPPQRAGGRSFAGLLAVLLSAHEAGAQEIPGFLPHQREPFFVFPDALRLSVESLPWISVVALVLVIGSIAASLLRRAAERRRAERRAILAPEGGERFMMLDLLVHAVRRGRVPDDQRLARAAQIAREVAGLEDAETRLGEASALCDRPVTAGTFRWMRGALSDASRRRLFETALAVLLESGPLEEREFAFLGCLARGIELAPGEAGELRWLLPA